MMETSEQISLNSEAMELAREIGNLPDVTSYIHQVRFKDEKIWSYYLGDIPLRLQIIIEQAFQLGSADAALTKRRTLYNFTAMCAHFGMRFLNPFNLFLLETRNYDKLLSGSI